MGKERSFQPFFRQVLPFLPEIFPGIPLKVYFHRHQIYHNESYGDGLCSSLKNAQVDRYYISQNHPLIHPDDIFEILFIPEECIDFIIIKRPDPHLSFFLPALRIASSMI
jgi:hypothetical protein